MVVTGPLRLPVGIRILRAKSQLESSMVSLPFAATYEIDIVHDEHRCCAIPSFFNTPGIEQAFQ